MKKSFLKCASLGILSFFMCASCNNNKEDIVAPNEPQSQSEGFVITSVSAGKGLGAGARMKVYPSFEQTLSGEKVYGDSLNPNVVFSADGFTQTSYNSQSAVFTGYIYRRGSSNKGIGASKMGVRTYVFKNGLLVENPKPYLLQNFGNVGVFGPYSYAVHNNDPSFSRLNADGTGQELSLDVSKFAIGQELPSISNIIDMGNNQIAVVLSYASQDKGAVLFTDYDLKPLVNNVVFDERIGSSVSGWRSVRYAMSASDDKGNVYVFCGNSKDNSKVGALRIVANSKAFDTSYKFDILAKADGYRFRKVNHIVGSKFLLEFYVDKEQYGNMNTSGRLAIVDMEAQTFMWVSGFPSNNAANISIGYGDSFNGFFYLPINPAEAQSGNGGGHGGGGGWHNGANNGGSGHRGGGNGASHGTRADDKIVPTIYKINATTGEATVWATFDANEQIKSFTVIKK